MKNTETTNADDDGLCTWTVTSWGGRKRLRSLMDTFFRESRKRPEILEHSLMPTVLLSAETKNSSYGTVAVPILKIVDWQEFGDGASPPGGSVAPSLLPATQPMKLVNDSSDEQDEETLAPPGNSKGDDYDDSIPF